MNRSISLSGNSDPLVLSQLFESTKSSKFLFFKAILNLLKDQQPASGSVLLDIKELEIEMAVLAWYPHTFFKLSFGAQDKIGKILDKLHFTSDERAMGNANFVIKLRQAVRDQYSQIKLEELRRYVPYRLLTPFFENQLRGMKDAQKNKLIQELSEESYASEKPALYRMVFRADSQSIEIHPSWVAYLTKSLPIVIGWADKNWINYLQSCNPNMPGIPNKIRAPLNRFSLKSQTKYWQDIINEKSLHCLYSGEILNPNRFELDHFIPWSYVGHNQIWNLIPVSPQANSSKNNHLPSEKIYLDAFITFQSEGLSIAKKIFNNDEWCKHTESFVSDLKISPGELLNVKKIRDAYNELLPPQLLLAKRIGFSSDWEYRK